MSSVWREGEVPQSLLCGLFSGGGEDTPVSGSRSFPGDVYSGLWSSFWGGGVGYPTPRLGYLPWSGLWYPLARTGILLPAMSVASPLGQASGTSPSPWSGLEYSPPNHTDLGWLCNAGGMPLSFTQEEFFVYFWFQGNIILKYSDRTSTEVTVRKSAANQIDVDHIDLNVTKDETNKVIKVRIDVRAPNEESQGSRACMSKLLPVILALCSILFVRYHYQPQMLQGMLVVALLLLGYSCTSAYSQDDVRADITITIPR